MTSSLKPSCNPCRGFTLVELLITVSVVAILLAIATPSFTDMFERRRLKSVAETIGSDLRAARTEAIARGPEDRLLVEFALTAPAWSYSITDVSGTTFLERDSADYYEGRIAISLTNADFGDSDLDGNRDFVIDALRGLTLDGDGSIVLTSSSGYSITVSRNLLGKVDLCSSDFSEFPTC